MALLRHASAPGFSDPPNFDLNDCSTQRNLSEAGRAEAARIGDAFRANGIEQAVVLSSQWCRALDTARLLDLGEVTPTPALNSFFEDRSSRATQTRAVQQLIQDGAGKRPRVFVTHQVNITALSGQSSASGELIVVRPGTGVMQTLGRIAPPD
ncbi:histidine phosphatase family protein [Salinisphaera dokdonensis]|uniref:histidine phosphatase family protein n=1 Tax=Salinisphaera dokdonensis TaxID=454598 RepID=UPI00333F8CE8